MRILALWIAAGLALCAGPVLAYAGGSPSLCRDLGVAAWVVAAVFGGVAVARVLVAPSGDRPWLVAAVLGLSLGRGLWAAGGDEPLAAQVPRGPAQGIRTLEVERASHPGPRCRLGVRDGGVSLWLDAPPSACPLARGQTIRVVSSRLHVHHQPELPGDPSPAAQARSRGAVALATVDRVWRGGGEASAYWRWVAQQRQRAFALTRGDRSQGFVVASALGVRTAMAPSDRDALRRAGLGHLIAVSGLHVAVAAWALLAVSLWARGRLRTLGAAGPFLSWGVLVGYVLLTGASPPAVRAGLMAVGVGLGGLLGRPHHGPVLLVVTSVLMLAVRPAWCLDPGFQLSVAAMATLVRAPSSGGVVHQTWRVTWAILPLSLLHFGQAGLWGLVSNIIAVPVFTLWVLPLGLLGSLVAPWLGALAFAPAGLGAQIVLDVAHLVSAFPVLPRDIVAALAAAGLVVGVLVGRRGADGRLRARWAWLPPAPVALAVVAVSVWPADPIAPQGTLWWAAGSPNAPAIVSVVEDESGSWGCLSAAGLRPGRWRTLLDAMGIERVALTSEPEAPHERALAEVLAAQGRLVEAPSSCPTAPDTTTVRDGLRRCRRRARTRHAMVVGTASEMHCFVGDRFESFAAHGGMSASDLIRSPRSEIVPYE